MRNLHIQSHKKHGRKPYWTKQKIIEKIMHLKKNRAPLYGAYLIQNNRKDLVMAGIRIFGSWGKAINASGLDYEKIKALKCKWWTKERIVSEINRLNAESTQLSSKYIQQTRADLYGAAKYYYGGWGQAVEAAGIDYSMHCKVWSYKVWIRKKNRNRSSK